MSSGRVTAGEEPLYKSAPTYQPPRSENVDWSPAPTTSLRPQPPHKQPFVFCTMLPPAAASPNLPASVRLELFYGCVSLFFCVWLPPLNIVLSLLRDAAGGCAVFGVQCCTAFCSDKVSPLCTVGSRSHRPRVATEHLKCGRWDSHHPLSVAMRLRPLGTSLSESHSVCSSVSGFLP